MDLQEQDRIVVFLARDQGKKRGVARAAKRKYSRFAGQLQPLAKVEATWFEKEGSELVRISSIELLRTADSLYSDLEGILLGSYLAGTMLEFAQEHEEGDLMYRLLDSTTQALLDGVDRQLAVRFFEAWVLRLAGIFPSPERCPVCDGELEVKGAAVPPSGEALTCRECAAGGWPLSPEAIAFLRRIDHESLRRLSRNPPSAAALAECEEASGRVRRAFLQHELKSYRVLRDTLREVAEP